MVDDEIDALRDLAIDVVPYIRDSDEISHYSAVGKAGLLLRPMISPADIASLRNVIRSTSPDIVHLHNPYPLISPAIIRTAHSMGIPIVQTVHNYRFACMNGMYYRESRICQDCLGRRVPWPGIVHGCYRDSRAQSLVMAGALGFHRGTIDSLNRLLPVSQFVAQELIRSGVPKSRISVKPNGVFDPGPAKPPGRGVLFVGRLDHAKGVRLLLEAWEIAKLGKRTTLTIAGDGPERANIQHLASTMDGVEYVGSVSPEQVGGLYDRCALVVVPSNWFEGLPRIIPEAFAHGRPVLATRFGAMIDAIGSDYGWLSEPNPNDLAIALSSSLDSYDQLASKGTAARAQFESTYSMDANIRSLISIYEDVCSLHRSRIPRNQQQLLTRHNGVRPRVGIGALDTMDEATSADSRLSTWTKVIGAPRRLELRITSVPPAAAAASAYVPNRSSARLATNFGIGLIRLGFRREDRAWQIPLTSILVDTGIVADGAAAFRSSSTDRWIVGIERSGRLTEVLKVGDVADTGLANEERWLERLDGRYGELQVPRLVGTWSDGERRAIVTQYLRPGAEKSRLARVDDACIAASILAKGTSSVEPVVHGDLAPWNLIDTGRGLALLDWEGSHSGALPMHDICHFVVRSGALLKWWSPSEAIDMVCGDDGIGERYLADAGRCDLRPDECLVSYLRRSGEVKDKRDSSYRHALAVELQLRGARIDQAEFIRPIVQDAIVGEVR